MKNYTHLVLAMKDNDPINSASLILNHKCSLANKYIPTSVYTAKIVVENVIIILVISKYIL